MKVLLAALVLCLVAVTVYSETGFLFDGNSVYTKLVRKEKVRFTSDKVEEWHYVSPGAKSIQGILAYDETNSRAQVNVTNGGTGYGYVTLAFKAGQGQKKIYFDVFIYTLA
ncbi:hypothetical protein O0L34_g15520 [Tuta absoluta]|nr:hypothetical protein O0L34_g15520 [Tuta absoluta]